MANTNGMKTKFIVLKTSDVNRFLSSEEMFEFNKLLTKIGERKERSQGRTAHRPNTYLVVNTDEPYADKVIDILKANGHWG